MTTEEKLASLEARFDRSCHLLTRDWNGGPGYHSHVPTGTVVHPLRENFEYAVHLLRSGDPRHARRAAEVLRACLEFQESDPMRREYGIWPWLAEEPLEKMAPPDWNWADFCGAAIAVILTEHPARLPEDLRREVLEALGRAAMAIFRRNVQPSYTNICVMGAGVSAAAGELLDMPLLLSYGRRRLGAFIEHTRHHGGLNEYNSPTYTFVALHECERILQITRDRAMRDLAETLRTMIWGFLAERFHPGTGQLAGPHSRAYRDLLSENTLAELARLTGCTIGTTVPHHAPDADVVSHLPCPQALCQRFGSLPEPELCVRSRFIRHADDNRSVYGTTWLSEQACLGSVSQSCTWIQRRPLIGYLAMSAGVPAVLKVEFLRDGKPCASAAIRNVQERNRVLSAFQFVTNKGDHHIHLDRPEGTVFRASDWRIRYRLDHPAAAIVEADDGRFVLSCGTWQAVLYVGAARLGGKAARWSSGKDAAGVFVDAVLWDGREREFVLTNPELGMQVYAGVVLVEEGHDEKMTMPTAEIADGMLTVCWERLRVTIPSVPYAI